MLAGFIVFPNAFDDQKSKFRVDANSLRVIAICLLVFAYILTGILCWRFKNLLFQVESIFLYVQRETESRNNDGGANIVVSTDLGLRTQPSGS